MMLVFSLVFDLVDQALSLCWYNLLENWAGGKTIEEKNLFLSVHALLNEHFVGSAGNQG